MASLSDYDGWVLNSHAGFAVLFFFFYAFIDSVSVVKIAISLSCTDVCVKSAIFISFTDLPVYF